MSVKPIGGHPEKAIDVTISCRLHHKFSGSVLHICCLSILLEGSWKLLSELKDAELKELASSLPATILHSQADSTVKKYLGPHRRWETWAIAHKVDPIPAKPHEFILYLKHLSEETNSKAAVKEACNALSWVHSSACLLPITKDSFVKATLESLQYIRPLLNQLLK